MTGTTTQEAGQFAGNTPFLGHNIQGHSVSVKLVREVPAEVLRTSVTHFGTRGLFGKPILRTSQHDHDNLRRKKWRIAQSLKRNTRKVKANPKGGGYHGASGDNAWIPPPNSNFPGPVNATARRRPPTPIPLPPLPPPPPFPSPPPNIVDLSSLPTHATQTRSQIRSASAYEESSCTATVPTSASGGTLPTFADYHSHILSPANHFGNAAASPHPSSHYAAPASEGDMYLDTRFCPLVSTLTEHSAIEAPLTTEPANVHWGVNASSVREPAFIWQASSGEHITTWTEQNPKVPHDGLDIDASLNIRITEINSAQRDTLDEKLLYWLPSSRLGAARSERPISTSVGREGESNQVYPSIPGGLHAAGETQSIWYGYPATSAAYAHASYTASISPRSPIAPSPPGDVSPGRNCMPLVNQYSTPLWSSSRREREDWGTSLPPNACSTYYTSPSLASVFNQYPGSDASRPVLTSPSDEFVSDLADRYTGGSATRYTPLPNQPIGSCGLISTSMSAPQDVWQILPELRLAHAVDTNVNINTNTSCTYPQPVTSGTDYAQAFDGNLSSGHPSWLSPIPHMSHSLAASGRTQRDNGARSFCFCATRCTPSQG
ncbi:hypothetical protein GSI_13158 [Ganoderma sinense ZZ0214-1]|uniref:Uncharacterized protein n=1 Tax=Ganoderma sinense ZZ0214-1 TaxID=1077348 RepID=A0A2G8RUU5_9APHY|nr:hypothetical protein GSI_13158 [Ganoderma sinense ZZ0214-1]